MRPLISTDRMMMDFAASSDPDRPGKMLVLARPAGLSQNLDKLPCVLYLTYYAYRDIMTMITVSSAEFQRNFGVYQDKALTEPVAITRNGRERIVMVSADEYRRLKRRAREVLPVGALSDADLAALERAEVAPRHQHLDRELE
jgi:prevent-host-death family protein